ncbi:MAG: thioredoxin domain-containing protein, partial [Steroidobacteraceae bacterium]
HPAAHASMLVALQEFLQPPQLVIIRGNSTEINQWQQALNQLYKPDRMVFAIDTHATLPESLARKGSAATTLAYVCHGSTCSAPLQSLESLIALTR